MENLDFINYYIPSDDDYFDLVSGLKDINQKKLNSKYFYDKKGSELFEKILVTVGISILLDDDKFE